jgi:spore germination cell wall hydrolase CwlJ-like protein
VITPIVETIRHNTLLINFSRSETDSELSFYHDNIATTQSATQVMLHELAYSSTEQPWTAINQWLLSRVPEEQQIHHTINLEVLPVDVDQFICLATNIYYEARGSSYDDQRAVALVTLNRARHWRWEGSICDVVWERYQFSWTITADHASRRVRENNSWETSQLIAYEVLTGGVHDITEGATNYYNPSVVRPRWGSMAVNPLRIGAHRYMQLTTTTNYERPENVPESNRRRLYSRAISRILN